MGTKKTVSLVPPPATIYKINRSFESSSLVDFKSSVANPCFLWSTNTGLGVTALRCTSSMHLLEVLYHTPFA